MCRRSGFPRFPTHRRAGSRSMRPCPASLALAPAERVLSADIDREALDWLAGGALVATVNPSDAWPPLPYDASFFELVYGTSVFTPPAEPTQFLWLKELARVCRPGGLVAVSV